MKQLTGFFNFLVDFSDVLGELVMGETDRALYDAMVSSIKNKFKIWTMRVNLKKSDGKFSTVSGKFHGIFPTNGFFLPMLDLTTNIDRKFSTVSGMIS